MTQQETIIHQQFDFFLQKQINFERDMDHSNKQLNGIYLTSDSYIIDTILDSIIDDSIIFSKTFLEPSCGHGIFIIKLILKAFSINDDEKLIANFIENNLYFADIDQKMLEEVEKNILELYFCLFNNNYTGKFNSYCVDFTRMMDDDFSIEKDTIFTLYNKIDYLIGNPPYISLYGRRDKKNNEEQREYYLKHYRQFPSTLKNGKINFVMLFIEHSLKFLKTNGKLSFIIDLAFFETAYMHCRKFIVENYTINSLIYNFRHFDNVGSGQIILEICNTLPINNTVKVTDYQNETTTYIEQESWNRSDDEYKFRISHCKNSDEIIEKIFAKKDPTLKQLYPHKNLRTCAMLLDMEEQFVKKVPATTLKSYPYYRGSSGLKYKYSKFHYEKFFYYDKALQDEINDKLKEELTLKGIKNKKRIGMGEIEVYDNPKLYIRQSAKELIASYDHNPSAANNSLYVFTLRDNSQESINTLKYLCGLINSILYTFFAQQRRIIRYNQGKQPQIKVSDLYQLHIPQSKVLENKIVDIVNRIYNDYSSAQQLKNAIDKLVYEYYGITVEEQNLIAESIQSF